MIQGYSAPKEWRPFEPIVLAFALGMVVLALASGCCKPAVCPKCPEPPAPLVVREPCLMGPPPIEKKVLLNEVAAACQPGTAPQLVGCLDSHNAIALAENVHAMQRWIKEAWARCGKP